MDPVWLPTGQGRGSKALSSTWLGRPGSLVLGHVLLVPSPGRKPNPESCEVGGQRGSLRPPSSYRWAGYRVGCCGGAGQTTPLPGSGARPQPPRPAPLHQAGPGGRPESGARSWLGAGRSAARRCPRWSRSRAGAGAAAQVALGEWWGRGGVGTPASGTSRPRSELSRSGEAGGWREEGVLFWGGGGGARGEPEQGTETETHTEGFTHARTQTHALGTHEHTCTQERTRPVGYPCSPWSSATGPHGPPADKVLCCRVLDASGRKGLPGDRRRGRAGWATSGGSCFLAAHR